jgi:hypothetical protein
MKCVAGSTRREYEITLLRQWGAGLRRTTCGPSVTGLSYLYSVT